MINHYEMLYLVPANYSEEELVPIKEKVKNLIKKFEGEVTAEDSLGKKKLAYPIKTNFQGYYLLYEFNLDGQNLKELDKNLKLASEVLRHIIVNKKIKAKKEAKVTEEKIKPLETKKESKLAESKAAEIEKGKIKLEDLDQKLDEILEGDIM